MALTGLGGKNVGEDSISRSHCTCYLFPFLLAGLVRSKPDPLVGRPFAFVRLPQCGFCSLAGCAALFKSRTAAGKADRRQRRAAGSAGGQQSRRVFGPGKPCCPLSDPGTQVLYRKCFGKEMQFAYKMRGRQLYKVYKHCKKFVKNSFEKRVGVLLAGRTGTLKKFSIFS